MKFIKVIIVKQEVEVSFIDARNDIIWITGEGKDISLNKMIDKHILNAIHMLETMYRNQYKNGKYYPQEWVKIFKMEIQFRNATRRLTSLASIHS